MKVRLNRNGVRKLLHDPGVVKHLEDRLRAVQSAYSRPSVITSSVHPSGRAVVKLVTTEENGLWKETKSGELIRAFNHAGASPEPVGKRWGPKRDWMPK